MAGTSGGPSRVRAALLSAWRALRRRCPRCGAGKVTQRWLILRPACPSCGLRLDRGESDYWLGAMLFNLIAAETLTLHWAAAPVDDAGKSTRVKVEGQELTIALTRAVGRNGG